MDVPGLTDIQAGLNSKNLDYVAKAIDKVVRETGGPKTD